MAKGATWRADVLRLYFLGAAVAMVADNAAALPFTNHVVALHTADPGVGGSQSTSEAAYAGYARQLVPRSAAGWTLVGNTVSLTADLAFPVCTASPGPAITHWSISRGGGVIDYSGPVTPTVAMATLVQPVVTQASTITES